MRSEKITDFQLISLLSLSQLGGLLCSDYSRFEPASFWGYLFLGVVLSLIYAVVLALTQRNRAQLWQSGAVAAAGAAILFALAFYAAAEMVGLLGEQDLGALKLIMLLGCAAGTAAYCVYAGMGAAARFSQLAFILFLLAALLFAIPVAESGDFGFAGRVIPSAPFSHVGQYGVSEFAVALVLNGRRNNSFAKKASYMLVPLAASAVWYFFAAAIIGESSIAAGYPFFDFARLMSSGFINNFEYLAIPFAVFGAVIRISALVWCGLACCAAALKKETA